MFTRIYLFLISIFLFYIFKIGDCQEVKGPLTSKFQEWLQLNGYSKYNFQRDDLGPCGSYGGSLFSNFQKKKTPIVFVHGNSDGALQVPGIYTTGFTKAIKYLLEQGYSSEDLYVTTWGDRNATNGGKRTHSCENIVYIRKFMEAVLKYTKSPFINVIGHSMGVTLARKAIQGVSTYDIISNNFKKCNEGRSLESQINVFIGLAGANYGLCSCAGIEESKERTCNNLNGFFPGNTCDKYLLMNNISSTPFDTCQLPSKNMVCLNEPNYSMILRNLNEGSTKSGKYIYSFWSTVDEILGPYSRVWGRVTAFIPHSYDVRVFDNLKHEEVKDNTILEQYSIIQKHEEFLSD
uniref:Lipase_3 domain-containing protein n=1 Tax=Parastrongyloides trichosuri TaxID=131310 RepID=A0A0N4ZC51_PARTI